MNVRLAAAAVSLAVSIAGIVIVVTDVAVQLLLGRRGNFPAVARVDV